MSAFNWFNTEHRAFDLRTKVVNAAYTVRVGTVANNFVVDRVINIVDPAADFTLTVPNGLYPGQQLMINLVSNGNSKTVTIDGNAAQDSTMATAGQYQISEWTNSTTGWVVLKESVTS